MLVGLLEARVPPGVLRVEAERLLGGVPAVGPWRLALLRVGPVRCVGDELPELAPRDIVIAHAKLNARHRCWFRWRRRFISGPRHTRCHGVVHPNGWRQAALEITKPRRNSTQGEHWNTLSYESPPPGVTKQAGGRGEQDRDGGGFGDASNIKYIDASVHGSEQQSRHRRSFRRPSTKAELLTQPNGAPVSMFCIQVRVSVSYASMAACWPFQSYHAK